MRPTSSSRATSRLMGRLEAMKTSQDLTKRPDERNSVGALIFGENNLENSVNYVKSKNFYKSATTKTNTNHQASCKVIRNNNIKETVLSLLILFASITTTMCCIYAQQQQQQQPILSSSPPSSSQQPQLNGDNNNILTMVPNQQQQKQGSQTGSSSLLICPGSSQHNNLPQFPPKYLNPKVIQQQREILKHLNASFTNYLQLNGPIEAISSASAINALNLPTNINSNPSEQKQQQQQLPPPEGGLAGALANELIDDELLNEIISPLVVDAAYSRAKEVIVKRRRLENELVRHGFVTDMSKPTAVARHQQVTTTTTRGNELEKAQEVFEEMSKILAKKMARSASLQQTGNRQHDLVSQLGNGKQAQNLNRIKEEDHESSSSSNVQDGDLLYASGSEIFETADSMQLLPRIDLRSSEARHAVSRCEEDQMIQCDPEFPYRHADGRCNNLQHPTWGKANTCFARLLAPDYSDGQSAPRISVTGHPLPNPRILSAIVHRDFNYPATYTHFVMQYGQFFAHDIAFTPSSRTKNGQMIQCCPIERDSHPQCFPILVPADDPFYSNWEESCLNFVRTAVCPRCRLGPREQMNQITSFIDGSQVYGSAANETAALWTKSGPAGRMHVSLDDSGRELLPHSADPNNDQCSDVERRQLCYRAGDRRVNQHPALTSVHVMWLRQHNRIVNGLKMVNPHWNGDRLYQEAKRISTAQMQMVTYNEWLSLIIGQDAMKFLKLNVKSTGYSKYDPSVDPSLLNEFAGAAFRFGHSMINNIFAEILPDGRPSGYRLNEFFFHPFGMKSGQHDMVMRGLISQASQNRDPFVSSDIKNHLYRPRDNPYGLDLPAFNIQRGRDHGIPGYTKLVEFCFDDVITNWKQLDQYMPVSQRIRFSKLYRSVHDLDLFSAGLAEYPLPGAALGPTFTCIVGIQMFNLKYGDRFWFEHGGQVGSFTPDQLQEIRKTNLARLMCANSDNMNIIQKNVFRGESPSNPSVPCSSLPDTDLKAWMEAPGTQSVFSKASEFMANNQEEYSPSSSKSGNNKQPDKRKRRAKPEVLGYPFRSSHSNGKRQRDPPPPQPPTRNNLGSEYPMPKNSYQQPQQHNNNNNNNNNNLNLNNHHMSININHEMPTKQHRPRPVEPQRQQAQYQQQQHPLPQQNQQQYQQPAIRELKNSYPPSMPFNMNKNGNNIMMTSVKNKYH